ncbi:MAG: response regulator [Anaerolineae bacterium]
MAEPQEKRLRVLLVDDNPDDRVLTARELEREFGALAVGHIPNPEALARALESGAFDLVITDYQLHWTNGLEVLRAVKERYPHRPVIMFTGTGNEEIAVEAMKAGLDDYVLKSPKHFRRLPATVRLVLARAEERRARQEAEARYQNLFERVPVGLYRTTPEGRILEANPALVAMLGYPDRETLLQTPVQDLYVDPEERARHLARLEEREVLQGVELRLRRYDGRAIWTRNTVRAVRDGEGRVRFYEGAMEDLTEEKARAQEVQAILETVPEGVLLLDGEGRIRQANPAARDLLAVLTEAREGDILRHLGPYSLKALLAPPKEGRWHEVRLEGPRPRFFEVAAEPLRGAGEGAGWVLVVREVTKEREARQQEEAQARLAAIGQLAAGIAHDFNNILTGIIGFSQLLARRDDIPEDAQRTLESISAQGQRAAQLVRQILDFSRKSISQQRPLDLVPFMEEALALLRRTIPESIRIVYDPPPGSVWVMGDPVQLQQALMNLVVNARDAMLGEGTLTLGLRVVDLGPGDTPPVPEMGPGRWVALSVQDTGCGMPSDFIPHIFEPFFTTKPLHEGAGLGLSQVYGIVKQHRGHIQVETEVGEGSTFTLYFPLYVPAEKPEAREEEALVPPVRGKGQLILFVEDNQAVREVGRRMLEDLGYEVVVAPSGQWALEVYERLAPQIALVISDMVMPGMSGKDLLRYMRELNPNVKVLLMSGYPRGFDAPDLSTPGVVGWLPKPFDRDSLGRAVEQAIGEP